MCIKNQQNALHFTYVFWSWYIHLRVSAGNPSFFRVTILLQEHSVIKSARLLHSTEITTSIG
jgi:hypothetical protein